MALPDLLPADDADRDDGPIHVWTSGEYEKAAAAGVFGDRRVELVEGVVYDFMTPQKSSHATGLRKACKALEPVFGSGYDIRSQLPLALGPRSLPEPDVAVVPGEPDDYRDSHPSQAVLVVEIADSSQLHDRKRKAAAYAKAGLPDYWIVNLRRDSIEVLREPNAGAYRARRVYRRGERITPLARPEASVAVDDLLPRRSEES